MSGSEGEFFDQQTAASATKARIVSAYFWVWAQIITKKYNEYIIDPQVTVSLDKAASYRYSVIGDVGQPGIRLMNHRMTVTEAIAEAGGVLTTGGGGGATPVDTAARLGDEPQPTARRRNRGASRAQCPSS